MTVTTCEQLGGSADYDTRMAIYDTCACTPTDGDLLGCNDDDPDNACGGGPDFHSTLTVNVNSGQCLLIRVGGFGSATGTGTLNITCDDGGGFTGSGCAVGTARVLSTGLVSAGAAAARSLAS